MNEFAANCHMDFGSSGLDSPADSSSSEFNMQARISSASHLSFVSTSTESTVDPVEPDVVNTGNNTEDYDLQMSFSSQFYL